MRPSWKTFLLYRSKLRAIRILALFLIVTILVISLPSQITARQATLAQPLADGLARLPMIPVHQHDGTDTLNQLGDQNPDVLAQDIKHPLRFSTIGVQDGLSHGIVHDMLRDSRGFMWFATEQGLNRYDGYNFKVYQSNADNSNSLSSDVLSVLLQDHNGNIWIGTRGDGLNKFDPKTETFTRYRHNPNTPTTLSNDSIAFHGLYEDPDGFLWIATMGGGLNRFDPSTETFTHYRHVPGDPTTLRSDNITSIEPYPDQYGHMRLWIGTRNGLHLLDPANGVIDYYAQEPTNPTSLGSNVIHAISADPTHDVVWVGTIDGLDRLDVTRETFTHYRHDPSDSTSIPPGHINDITRAEDGTLWIVALRNGIFHFDPEREQWYHYTHSSSDPFSIGADLVDNTYYDQNGILWTTVWGKGVSFAAPSRQKFQLYQHNPESPQSLSHSLVSAVLVDSQQRVWVGTDGGGLDLFTPATQTFTHYQYNPDDPTSLSNNRVFALYEDERGTIWVGTAQGVNIFDPDTAIFTRLEYDVNDPLSVSNATIRTITGDGHGTIWIGTYQGGLYRFDDANSTITSYRFNPEEPGSLRDNRIWDVLIDSTGTLWVGTETTLERFDATTNTFTHYAPSSDTPHALHGTLLVSLYEDSQHRLWVGTDGGLNLLDRATHQWTTYTTEYGLPHNRIGSIIEDHDGFLWIGTSKGLARFDPETATTRVYDMFDGLQGYMFTTGVAAIDSNGMLYFGGNNGLNVFHPDDIHDNPNVPPVVLTDVRLFNDSVPIGRDSLLQQALWATDEIVLTHNDMIVSFEFAALSYAAPEKNRYRYQLIGFEDEMNETDSYRRFATYTNLPAGRYLFHVIGSNNDGVWNTNGVSLTVIVLPPWWETWWVQGLVVMMVFGIVVWMVRWRGDVQERRRFRALAEATFEGIVIHARGRILEVNQMMSQLFGYEYHELVGMHVFDLTDDVWHDIVAQRIHSGKDTVYELEGRHKDGHIFPMELRVRESMYHGNRVSIVSVRDMTEQKQTQTALLQARDAAEAANRAKSSFLANMSHELRSPLNAILGFAQLLHRSMKLPAEQQEHLQIIRKSGQHLLSLINDILDMSKIEAGRMVLYETRFDLYRLLDDLETLFQWQANEKQVHLSFDCSPDVPQYIVTDERKLRQVLMNLLSNAIKFTKQGSIHLSVTRDQCDQSLNAPTKPSELHEHAESRTMLRFRVRDTGIGLTSEEIGCIFNPFIQTVSGQKDTQGTGLGLAISSSFVHLLGGNIMVQSTPGQGATFCFHIAVQCADAPKQQPALRYQQVTGLAPEQPPYRILVVDDQAVNCYLLSSLLIPIGFKIREASNGQEALDVWEAWHPHCIFLDIRMPMLDGFATARAIRSHADGQDTILIAATANVLEDSREEIFSAGFNAFLYKPFQAHEIFAVLEQYVGVSFIFQTTEDSVQSMQPKQQMPSQSIPITADDLVQLSPTVLQALEEATLLGDVNRVNQILAHIEPTVPTIAAGLKKMSDKFEQVRLIELINQAQDKQ